MFSIFVFICFQFSVYLLTVLFSGCRIKCTGEASVAPTEGDFPVVCVMQHLKGLCILKQSQLLLNRISFLLLFYVPNPEVHWAWISECRGPVRRLFWLSQIVVPENILKLIVLKKKKERKKKKEKKGSSPKTKQEQLL